MQPGSSYLCSNDPRVHFGLGDATQVDGPALALAGRHAKKCSPAVRWTGSWTCARARAGR